MGRTTSYWIMVGRRAWRRSLEIVRLDGAERVLVLAITLLVPTGAVWFWIGNDVNTTVRLFASLGATLIAVALIFAWSLVKLPAVIHAETEVARKALEEEKALKVSRRQKRDELGRFLERGSDIMRAAKNRDQPPPIGEAEEWHRELLDYLDNSFGKSYVARVNDGSSAPVGFMSQYREHDTIYNSVRIRVFHIQEFLKEFQIDE